MDFVPNHVSFEHEFFQKALKNEGDFHDYFIWNSGIDNPDKSDPRKKLPPNNWLRIGAENGESMWEWSEERQEFFFFQFGSNMPDLNLRNEKVLEHLKEALKYWLDLGIAGFRIDAISSAYETTELTNETLREGGNEKVWADYDHKYTMDQPEDFELVYEWRKFLDDYRKKNGGDER